MKHSKVSWMWYIERCELEKRAPTVAGALLHISVDPEHFGQTAQFVCLTTITSLLVFFWMLWPVGYPGGPREPQNVCVCACVWACVHSCMCVLGVGE